MLDDLSRAPNGILMGEALAEKLGVKAGNTVLLIGGQGVQLNSTVAGLYRSGLKRLDTAWGLTGRNDVLSKHTARDLRGDDDDSLSIEGKLQFFGEV